MGPASFVFISGQLSRATVDSLMRGSVRGCHNERDFHCGLFPLSLTMYFTNLFSCITLSIGYLSYEGAMVLARIAMLFNLCFQCQFVCGSWLGQPGAAGNDRTLQDFLISSLFSVKIFLGVLSSGSWWGGHTLCTLWRLFLPHLFRRDIQLLNFFHVTSRSD